MSTNGARTRIGRYVNGLAFGKLKRKAGVENGIGDIDAKAFAKRRKVTQNSNKSMPVFRKKSNTPKKPRKATKAEKNRRGQLTQGQLARASRSLVQKKGSTAVVKNRKKPKVDKKFRAKVQQSLEDKIITSVFHETYWHDYTYLNANNNTQRFEYIGWGQYFDPLVMLDAASVLFNSKVAVSRSVRTETRDFNKEDIKFYVKNSFVKFTIKNNSPKKYHFILYTCTAKQATVLDGNGPLETWNDAINLDIDNEVNVSATGRDIMYAKPDHHPMFNKYWSWKKQTMVFEAGESTEVHIQGPKDMWLDYKKFNIKTSAGAEEFVRRQKFAVAPFFIMYPELSATYGGLGSVEAGRFSGDAGADGHGFCIEERFQAVIGMPEQTGFTISGAGAGNVNQLNKRKSTYSFKQYSTDIASPTYVNINPENPVVNTAH